ncbi:MAG: hypothetical protein MH137_01535 [Flavobacteriales bacterium]|nr:hypothetical protein [Flavobacteriales bacterium]
MRIIPIHYKHGLLALSAVLFSAVQAAAQSGTFNPYSQLGIGTPVSNPVVPLASMGGGFNAMRADDYINFYNPASYSAFNATQLQFGFETISITGTRGSQRRRADLAYFNQISIAVPLLKDRVGMAFGYTPYSNVGYKFGTTEQIINDTDTLDVNYSYEGKGGTDRVFIGFGGSPVKGLSIGFNTYFYIGNIETLKTSFFPDGFQSTNVQQISGTRIADFGFDFGAQYVVDLNDKLKLTLGGTYALGKNMNARRSVYARYFTGELVDNYYSEDTIMQRQKVKLRFPSSFGGGVSLGRKGFWSINADFNMNMWSSFRYANSQPEPLFGNAYRVSLGGEIKPNGKNQKNIFNKLTYRLGARYGNSYLLAGGKPFQEIGISFGLGIPVLSNALIDRKLLSNFNVGMEYGMAIPNGTAYTREQTVRFVFAFNLKDNWFRTYKYK